MVLAVLALRPQSPLPTPSKTHNMSDLENWILKQSILYTVSLMEQIEFWNGLSIELAFVLGFLKKQNSGFTS
jgi:hypothetical protein